MFKRTPRASKKEDGLYKTCCLSRRPGGDLLSRALRHSTISAEGFHVRVRDGIGCRPLAKTTRSSRQKTRFTTSTWKPEKSFCVFPVSIQRYFCWTRKLFPSFQADWFLIERSQKRLSEHICLATSVFRPLIRIKPIELLVPVSYAYCYASTPGLSTWWSITALREC